VVDKADVHLGNIGLFALEVGKTARALVFVKAHCY